VEKNKISEDLKISALNNITLVPELNALKAHLIIEAAIEKLEVKKEIFSILEKVNEISTILTTNTSSIPVTQIGSILKTPQRFAGLHFFNPAAIMKLIEVIKGPSTDDEVLNTLKAFAKKLGKVPVLATDAPGFIVNRVARPYYVESLKLLEENVTDFKTIDLLLKNSGFKMGPFELMDLIGVDTNLSVTTSMFHLFNEEPRFRPNRIQQQKVAAGLHGKKSGQGFYTYTK
jgi:3-hydroxybutyryl-CoA dehydrogenase